MSRLLTLFDSAAGALGGGGGFTWYVDSVNGDDANTGTSPAQAFASIAALESAGISAGNSIGLARGSEWREQLDITVNDVAVAAYGTGNAPILRADNVAANASFSKTAGQTNVYEIAVSLAAALTEQFCNVYEDDSPLTRVADVATCDSTASSCYVTAEYGNVTIYVHASDSSDVTANGKTYEYSARNYGFTSGDASGCAITGIHTMRNQNGSGSLIAGRSSTLTDCVATDGSKHNVYVKDGCILTNVTATDAYWTGNTTLFVYNESTPAGLGVSFINCTATQSAYSGSTIGFYGHRNGASGTFGDLIISGCTVSNCVAAFEFAHIDSVATFANNTIDNCYEGYRVDHPVSITGLSGISGTATLMIVNIRQAVAVTISDSGFCLKNGDYGVRSTTTPAVVVEDCVASYSDEAGSAAVVRLTTAAATITYNRNTHHDLVRGGWFDNASLVFVGDYNSYGLTVGPAYQAGTFYNLANWQTHTGQDANSTASAGNDTSAAPC